MQRRTLIEMAPAAVVAYGMGGSSIGRAADWKDRVKEFRVGLLGGENTADRLKKYDGFQHLLQEKLGHCSEPKNPYSKASVLRWLLTCNLHLQSKPCKSPS